MTSSAQDDRIFLAGLPIEKEQNIRTYMCTVCGYIYDEAQGDPEHGIAAGTRWEAVPEDWYCPECGMVKAKFKMQLI